MGFFDNIVNVVASHCSLCNDRLVKNWKKYLDDNFKTHSFTLKKITEAKYICAKCAAKYEMDFCRNCKKSFTLASSYEKNYKGMDKVKAHNLMRPYSNYYDSKIFSFKNICPTCTDKLITESKRIENLVNNWICGTKLDYVKDFKIIKKLGLVEFQEIGCSDPNQLEEKLKLFSAQLGGNGFIKFFWNKKVEKSSKKVIAGYSKNNNPYYKTEYSTKTYFTGSATAVYLETENNNSIINTNIDDASYKYVIECSQALEKYIENNLNGQGKGLHEKITSIEDELSAKDIKSFRFIATARNNIIHEGKVIGDSEKFKNTCEQLKLKYNLK